MTETTKEISELEVGDTISGHQIKTIVGRTDSFIVCTVDLPKGDDVGVHWKSIDTFTDEQRLQIAAFNNRYDDVKDTFQDDPNRVENLAFALYQGLCSPGNESGPFFGEIDKQLLAAKDVASTKTRTVYGVSATVLTLIFVPANILLALWVGPPEQTEIAGVPLTSILLAAAAGSTGSLASVLQKLRKLEVSHYPGRMTAGFGGCLRVVLGGIFGIVLFLGTTAGLLLSALNNIPGGILLVGFIGGVSERLVPEMISKLESSETKKN